jgi:hypothetical protein
MVTRIGLLANVELVDVNGEDDLRVTALEGRHPVRMTSVPTGPDAIILRLPLLQGHHRRLANPATHAAHAQEEKEETNACDEPSHAVIQLPPPCHWFSVLVSTCLAEYPWRLLLTRR